VDECVYESTSTERTSKLACGVTRREKGRRNPRRVPRDMVSSARPSSTSTSQIAGPRSRHGFRLYANPLFSQMGAASAVTQAFLSSNASYMRSSNVNNAYKTQRDRPMVLRQRHSRKTKYYYVITSTTCMGPAPEASYR
jgi:hypothetical protein